MMMRFRLEKHSSKALLPRHFVNRSLLGIVHPGQSAQALRFRAGKLNE